MPDASTVFADWMTSTRELLKWSDKILESVKVKDNGVTRGADAALRLVAHEIQARRIELINNKLNGK